MLNSDGTTKLVWDHIYSTTLRDDFHPPTEAAGRPLPHNYDRPNHPGYGLADRAIKEAKGFDAEFTFWWRTRPANYRSFESWSIRQRCSLLKARRQEHIREAFQDVNNFVMSGSSLTLPNWQSTCNSIGPPDGIWIIHRILAPGSGSWHLLVLTCPGTPFHAPTWQLKHGNSAPRSLQPDQHAAQTASTILISGCLLQQLSQVLPRGILGFIPGRETGDFWYYTQALLECALQQQLSICGCTTDIRKAFEHIRREVFFQTATALGFPPRVLGAWQAFLQQVQRHFLVQDHLSTEITSNSGFPEGCSLSVVCMCIIDWIWDAYQSAFAPSTIPSSYVDNLELLARDVGSLLRGQLVMEEFYNLWALCLDPEKTYYWATNGKDRSFLRQLGHRVELAHADLGGLFQSIDRAELMAILMATRWLIRFSSRGTIWSDSSYAACGLRYQTHMQIYGPNFDASCLFNMYLVMHRYLTFLQTQQTGQHIGMIRQMRRRVVLTGNALSLFGMSVLGTLWHAKLQVLYILMILHLYSGECWSDEVSPALAGQLTLAQRIRFIRGVVKAMCQVFSLPGAFLHGIDVSGLRIHMPLQGLAVCIDEPALSNLDRFLLAFTAKRPVRTANDVVRPL
ncbi:unnamed protein product [Effrenium voratum]|uniref:Reverse transcriptase domain-containing protein n=1 Tax=Effrenium voratum TaxID=2562239 RepID=A0AA36JSK1_9DINO|nr:unnamed protein product [Effrenium voratum]